MPINPVVAVIPVPQAVAQADLPQSGVSMANALAQVVQQSETATMIANSGASLSGLDAISQIAANAGVKPKPRALPREEGAERERPRHPLLNLF